jgi:hypothetical protein
MPDHPYVIGENCFIRTVTHHYVGRLIAVYPLELVMEKVSWIPDDGRFADAMATGNFNEVEPYPEDKKIIIGRYSILDASTCDYPLPHKQK